MISDSAKIHPTAVIADTAWIGSNAVVNRHAVIEDNVTIGRDAQIASYAVVLEGAVVECSTHVKHHTRVPARHRLSPDGTVVPL